MKILIISDTHGHNENLDMVLEKTGPLDLIIHLGDLEGSQDYISYMGGCPIEIVKGNNDFFSYLPKELILKLGNYNAFLTHGNMYNVNHSLDALTGKAKEKEVDIVMFGHTHRPLIVRDRDLVILNPGSLSYPRQEGRLPSYIIMEIDSKGEAHYTINYLKY